MNRLPAFLISAILIVLAPFSVAIAARDSAQEVLVLGVTEGTAGGADAAAAAAQKYAELAAMIGKVLDRRISLEYVRKLAALDEGMKARRFDIVLARPTDYLARAIRDYGYQFVATAEPAIHCELMVPKTSSLKSVKELRDKYFILPQERAYITNFCLAALRDEGIRLDKNNMYFVGDQDAILFGLDHGMADVGGVATNTKAFRNLKAAGYRVLYESIPQPFFPVIAAPSIDAQSVRKLQRLLTGLGGTSEGRDELERIGIAGFVTTEEQRLRELLTWLFPK